MNDIVKPVTTWISNNVPWTVLIVFFLFCVFFEISKIKIYPLKWMWKGISWPFRKMNETRTAAFKVFVNEMKADIDIKLEEVQKGTSKNYGLIEERFKSLENRFHELDGRLDNLSLKQDQTDERLDKLAAARIKNHVLNFARQCRKGEAHSHEDFANLFKENQTYEELVSKYGWDNDVYKHDFAYIQRVYDGHNDNGNFIE